MPTKPHVDAELALLLSSIPAYGRWSNQPLPQACEQLLQDADSQELMTIAVEALHRVMTDPVNTSRQRAG